MEEDAGELSDQENEEDNEGNEDNEDESEYIDVNKPTMELPEFSNMPGTEESAESILEKQNEEFIDDNTEAQLKAIDGRLRVDANGRPVRSATNAKMTTFERTKILITRAKQLQLNAQPLINLSYQNNPLTAGMSKQQYQLWYRRLVLDPLALAQLELDSGKLNNWVVLKVYPDNSYEVWRVGELPYLRG